MGPDCTSAAVELSHLEAAKQQDGKVWFVVTGPDGCSTELHGDCSDFREALKMVPDGGRKLVNGTAFWPGEEKLQRVSLTVRRAGKGGGRHRWRNFGRAALVKQMSADSQFRWLGPFGNL
jgi:hypothetical protein